VALALKMATGELTEIERLTVSSERGGWKSAHRGNSLAAYSTSRTVPRETAGAVPAVYSPCHRVRRAKQALWPWRRHNRRRPLKEPYQALCQKVRTTLPVLGHSGGLPSPGVALGEGAQGVALLAEPSEP